MKKALTIIGASIVAPIIVGVLVNWLTPLDVIGILGSVASGVSTFLTCVVQLPFWALVLVAFAWPILRYANMAFARSRESEALPPEMQFLYYTSDSFFGVKWLWSYTGNSINENSITARCPKCECLLDWVEESSFRVVDNITLICPSCDFRKVFDRNENGINRLVYQHIDRMIVSGEYKEHVQQDESTAPQIKAPSASSDVR